jgi:hypothetical protein
MCRLNLQIRSRALFFEGGGRMLLQTLGPIYKTTRRHVPEIINAYYLMYL